ncbi:exodeoxyribonuclease VII large subunit [Lewinella marina]|uniref:Exodeoxyribonuclease 7 large subunit n=1 Tax=Neolewinella marina TaxID=438751 RepID=A0A2G0CFF0_9BACT|nr:exodeoxyribonuclease VII large subunit [Neolewinella marina]NJB85620.1 exodeoxyribonuclease VII large subunit [Neolewinella marina]PHK98695.1 exodeoxyribonuclease VII large subunit [Neolewinella marina]
METMPLSQLATFIRRVFALNLPEPVWVAAELAQVQESRGHTWLTLVEKGEGEEAIVAQLEGVIWSSTRKQLEKAHGLRLLRGLLQEGMSVRLRVSASFHERYGLKLIVEDLDPEHTLGSLERRRQATLEALSRDGLLDRNAQRPLPVAPQRLAVISADTAAGWSDFRRQLAENVFGYAFTTDLYAAAMQGVQTTEEITTRLRQIGRRSGEYDLIVIVRGGGGKTDLAAFDDERLCRAVADAPLPVVAGIGHEIDATVMDRVVHRSLKTPTAVAAYLIDRLAQTEATLLGLGRRIAATSTARLHEEDTMLNRRASAVRQSATALLEAGHLRTDARERELLVAVSHQLDRANDLLDKQTALLDALRPETTLARGYALVSQAGSILTDPQQVKAGEVEVRLRDGKLRLKKD